MARQPAKNFNSTALEKVASELVGLANDLRKIAAVLKQNNIENISIDTQTSAIRAIGDLRGFFRDAELKTNMIIDANTMAAFEEELQSKK